MISNLEDLKASINSSVGSVKIVDIHTHLVGECFGKLFLYGIDELLTYHYLIAETFIHITMDYNEFWSLSTKEQADIVWKTLFVENTPISEPARSILTVFNKLGLDVNNRDLDYYRNYFNSKSLSAYIDEVFKLVGLDYVVMTNDPLNDDERKVWDTGYVADNRFKAALRIDPILNSWHDAVPKLMDMGYNVKSDLSGSTIHELKRFLTYWIDRMGALYCAVSMSPDFVMNDGSARTKIIEECILPVCREKNIPMALMIGVNRQINPGLQLAGDSLGKADISPIEYLCSKYPKNKFMVTMLSLENQHEIAITARKFRNLLLFGCWWFLNTPTIIDRITRIRLEWLGNSFIPQHSDARVFEHLLSKWEHSKTAITQVLIDKYSDLMKYGYQLSEEQIKSDIESLFGGNFNKFIKLKL